MGQPMAEALALMAADTEAVLAVWAAGMAEALALMAAEADHSVVEEVLAVWAAEATVVADAEGVEDSPHTFS